MKIWYKIYIILSSRFNKIINDKIEMKISQLIHESVSVGKIASNHENRYKLLVLSEESKNKTLLEYIKIIFYILKIRGLLRTILMLTKPFPDTSEYILLSRFIILTKIISHHKIFKRQFLSKLSFDYNSFNFYKLGASFAQTNLLNESQIELYSKLANIVFEKPANTKYLFSSSKNDPNYPDLFIEEFIRWNSKLFIFFMLRNPLQNSVHEFLLQFYPAVSNEFRNIKVLPVYNHYLSNTSLDKIFEKKAFGSCDEIIDAEILHQRFIKSGENILNLDSTSSVRQKFVAGIWPYLYKVYRNNKSYTLIMPSNHEEGISEGIYLVGRCDENWFHFLLDTLPRLQFFDSISIDAPLLMRADIPKTSKDLVSKLTKRKIIELKPNSHVKVSKLYVCPGRSVVFDVKPPKNVNWVEISPIILDKLREKIMNCLADESFPIISGTIFISRKSAKRNLINIKVIEKVCVANHVPIYDIDDEFIRNQIKIFSSAKHVISPGGAVLANIIFMKPGSKITVLRSYGNNKLKIWKQLAEIRGLEYSEIIGVPLYFGSNFLRRLHSDFYVSPRKLRKMLSEEI